MARLTKDEVAAAVTRARGNITRAADALGVSRLTVYNYIERYPELAGVVDDARESRTDYVESKLMERIDKGDTTAIIFYLKTQGKRRGYVERVETTGADGGPVEVEVKRQGEADSE